MNAQDLLRRFHGLSHTQLQRPGAGATPERHRAIFNAGREDLSLAKLIEAHWDAVAILEEAGMEPVPEAIYAVWASEIPGKPLTLVNGELSGAKEFCSGAALVDRALVSAGPSLCEVDLRAAPDRITLDESGWQTDAFRMTRTATVSFHRYPVASVLGDDNWYTRRNGFWQGACGPAAAWAGGAAALLDHALRTKRDDAHTLAHLGAMASNVWAAEAILHAAGEEFDRDPRADAMVRALEVRHLIEQLCTGVIRRYARSLGPAVLVKNANQARQYAELDLYLRQSHAERDLETLGRALRQPGER